MTMLRVSHIPQIPGKAFIVPVDTLEAARDIMHTLADYDLFLESENIRGDYSNANFLEMYEDGEWIGWMDDETGIDDIDDYFDMLAGE